AGALDGEAPVLLVQGLAELLVALEEERTEAEELDLLRVVVVREDVLEIVEPAGLGGSPVLEAERAGRELHLDDGGGDGGDDEAEDGEPAPAEEEGDVAGEGDRVLEDLENLRDHRERAGAGLAPGAGEAVVELRVLEVGQIQAERLLHDEDVDVDEEARADERADEAD